MILITSTAGFIATPQKPQGLQVVYQEETAHRQGWIDVEQLAMLAYPLKRIATDNSAQPIKLGGAMPYTVTPTAQNLRIMIQKVRHLPQLTISTNEEIH